MLTFLVCYQDGITALHGLRLVPFGHDSFSFSDAPVELTWSVCVYLCQYAAICPDVLKSVTVL